MQPQLLQALELYEELAGPQKYRKVHTPFVSDERLEDLVGKFVRRGETLSLRSHCTQARHEDPVRGQKWSPGLTPTNNRIGKNGYEVGLSL